MFSLICSFSRTSTQRRTHFQLIVALKTTISVTLKLFFQQFETKIEYQKHPCALFEVFIFYFSPPINNFFFPFKFRSMMFNHRFMVHNNHSCIFFSDFFFNILCSFKPSSMMFTINLRIITLIHAIYVFLSFFVIFFL